MGRNSSGGGIFNAGSLNLRESTLFGNMASGSGPFGSPGSGGAIENSGILSITNSTFSGNAARGGDGSFFSFGGSGYGGEINNSGTLYVTNSEFPAIPVQATLAIVALATPSEARSTTQARCTSRTLRSTATRREPQTPSIVVGVAVRFTAQAS